MRVCAVTAALIAGLLSVSANAQVAPPTSLTPSFERLVELVVALRTARMQKIDVYQKNASLLLIDTAKLRLQLYKAAVVELKSEGSLNAQQRKSLSEDEGRLTQVDDLYAAARVGFASGNAATPEAKTRLDDAVHQEAEAKQTFASLLAAIGLSFNQTVDLIAEAMTPRDPGWSLWMTKAHALRTAPVRAEKFCVRSTKD